MLAPRSLVVLAALATLVPGAALAAPATAETDTPLCWGEPATIVGPGQLRGTDGDDVIGIALLGVRRRPLVLSAERIDGHPALDRDAERGRERQDVDHHCYVRTVDDRRPPLWVPSPSGPGSPTVGVPPGAA